MRLFLIILSLCTGLHLAPAAAKELVVIAASNAGPALSPGKALKPGQKIVLPAGARITVLAKSGEVIKLKGPYSGGIRPKGKSSGSHTLASVSKLLSAKKGRSRRLGATRSSRLRSGGAGSSLAANAWLISADRSGSACWHPEKSALLRSNPGKQAAVSISAQAAQTKGLIWPAGKAKLSMDKQSIASAASIKILTGGKSSTIKVTTLPADLSAAADGVILQWMAEQGCDGQSRRLIRQLHGG